MTSIADTECATGIVLTGGRLGEMGCEEQQALAASLGEVVGAQGHVVTVTLDAEGQASDIVLAEEQEPRPVFIHSHDAHDFARRYGYLDTRTVNDYWASLTTTAGALEKGYYHDNDSGRTVQFPNRYQAPITMREHEDLVDFRSVYARILISQGNPDAWTNGTRTFVQFLCLMTNEFLKPEWPLEADLPVVREPEELNRQAPRHVRLRDMAKQLIRWPSDS